jgi:hypothetical protein
MIIQENCQDIYEGAKQINKDRAVKGQEEEIIEETTVDGQEEDIKEETTEE